MAEFHGRQSIIIRVAKKADAPSIINAHISAILGTAAAFYPEAIVKEWADPGNPDRLRKFQDHLGSGEAALFVAEVSGEIVGFSELIPKYNEVRAVYVSSDWGGKGIGSLLLAKLEEEATKLGLDHLKLSSSINAQRFYARHGYETLEKSIHRLRSGAEMECYRMKKCIGG